MIKSRAIVLHRYAYSDSSWIVKALTEECGIVSFIVKGGKRKESPFKGALDPLALSEVVFRQNPNIPIPNFSSSRKRRSSNGEKACAKTCSPSRKRKSWQKSSCAMLRKESRCNRSSCY